MKRIVITFDCKFKKFALYVLDSFRVQYSMSTDIYLGVVRVSVPHAKGVRFLAELRRFSIPYELI